MSASINRELLHQHWVHVHEEDTPTQMVFRPAGTDLPLSRGRSGFELKPDQSMGYCSIGRGDTPEQEAGVWTLEEGDPPQLHLRINSGEMQMLPIVSVAKNCLVLAKDQ